MKSGTFRHLFLTNAGIVLVVLILLAVTVTAFADRYFYQQKQGELVLQGKEVCSQVALYLNGDLSLSELSRLVDAIGSSSGTRVMVLKARPDEVETLEEQLGASDGTGSLVRLYESVLAGKQVAVRKQYASKIGLEVTMVGMPVYAAGRVGAVVFLYAPLEELSATLRGFYLIIWGCAALATVLAAAIVYLVSRRMTRPLLAMADGARRLARGESIPDYPDEGTDEVIDLAGAMNYMKHELARTEQVRQELITNVSHELRTPLTTIGGFIRAILDGVVPQQEERRYLALADGEVQRLTRLVQDLLTLSRLRAGTTRMDFAPVDLTGTARKAIEMMSLAAADAGTAIDLRSEGSSLTYADEDRMLEVMINLLQNGIGYAPEGSRVILSLGVQGQEVLFEVEDNGPGIPAEDLPFVFDRFYRGGGGKKAGTGVGLAIVREIVLQHGGRVEARSVQGCGTTMAVWLPLFTKSSQSGQQRDIDDL